MSTDITDPLMMDLDFADLKPKEVKINNLMGKNYILIEASAEVGNRYRNAVLGSAKFDEKGKLTGAKNLADAETLLVASCLVDAETRKPVSQSTILQWPDRLQKQFARIAKHISGLDVELKKKDGDSKKQPSDGDNSSASPSS